MEVIPFLEIINFIVPVSHTHTKSTLITMILDGVGYVITFSLHTCTMYIPCVPRSVNHYNAENWHNPSLLGVYNEGYGSILSDTHSFEFKKKKKKNLDRLYKIKNLLNE